MIDSEECHQSRCKTGRGEGKLNGNHLRLIPGLYLEDKNKLIGEFKIVAGDGISIRYLWSTCTFEQELKGS